MQRGQKLDAGVHRAQRQAAHRLLRRCAAVLGQFADDDGAGTAVARVAAFLGAGAAGVLAQPVEHGARGVHAADFNDSAAVKETDGLGSHGEWMEMGADDNPEASRFCPAGHMAEAIVPIGS